MRWDPSDVIPYYRSMWVAVPYSGCLELPVAWKWLDRVDRGMQNVWFLIRIGLSPSMPSWLPRCPAGEACPAESFAGGLLASAPESNKLSLKEPLPCAAAMAKPHEMYWGFSSLVGAQNLSWLKIDKRCSVLTEPSFAINYPSGWLKCIISICFHWLSAYERHCQVPNKYRVSYTYVISLFLQGSGQNHSMLSSILPPAVVRLISPRDSQIGQEVKNPPSPFVPCKQLKTKGKFAVLRNQFSKDLRCKDTFHKY